MTKKQRRPAVIRLNKYLAECGAASRRKSDELILQGRVSVNGKVVEELGYKVEEENDIIKLDGERIRLEKREYFILYKPKGTVTTTQDEKGRQTVINLIHSSKKLFPIGRLDYNTTGVLLITNDGDFANLMMHPRYKIPRDYSVKLDKDLMKDDKMKLLQGIFLDNRKSRFDKIEFKESHNYHKVEVRTFEGRNHFVKRMFKILGYQVKELKRIRFGNFELINLKPGEYRKVKSNELKIFYDMYIN